MSKLPLGKLPPDLLAELLSRHAPSDERILLKPGLGLDCTVIDFGDRLLVAKSDPITFTAQEIGWYAVHVNANDIATTGAQPRWFLGTLLLPENESDTDLVESIFAQIDAACREVGAELVGGHTEITSGLDRPILAGTMLGEIAPERLITPRGAIPGDVLMLTKGIPIEATSIMAREFADQLSHLPPEVLARAADYLHQPGISVVPEALAAAQAGGVTAMHDPTEGGLAAALWELAHAAGVGLEIEEEQIPICPEGRLICQELGVNPAEAIASGALLLTANAESVDGVREAIQAVGVDVHPIGRVVQGSQVRIHSPGGSSLLSYPERDALALLFERG